MSMTIQEAIKRINEHMSIHHIGQYPHIHLADALHMALDALREKAERENPKPLTFEELRQMEGEVVWLEVIDKSDRSVPYESVWGQVCLYSWDDDVWFWRFGNECEIDPKNENYGKTWICYRHKPKEVTK